MKWLVVLFSLLVHTQVSAVGLCKPTADGEGMSDECIAGWNGATKAVAYGLSLAAMLEKFTINIVHDAFDHTAYWLGSRCELHGGEPNEDPPIPARGCRGQMPLESAVNVSLANSFHRTLVTAIKLMEKLESGVIGQITYRFSPRPDPELHDKQDACHSRFAHSKIAPLWADFADNFQRDYDAYQDKYRKKIFKHYFQAIKRLYGIYANRMKKLMKKVKREYDCTN